MTQGQGTTKASSGAGRWLPGLQTLRTYQRSWLPRDVLRELEAELAAEGVDLRFAEMKDPVKDRLKRYGLFDRFGDDHFYPTIGEAVNAYVDATGIEWTDWEDRSAPTHPGSR